LLDWVGLARFLLKLRVFMKFRVDADFFTIGPVSYCAVRFFALYTASCSGLEGCGWIVS